MEWKPEELKAHIGFMHQLNRELRDAGELVGAEGLAPPADARIVRAGKNGAPAQRTSSVPERDYLMMKAARLRAQAGASDD